MQRGYEGFLLMILGFCLFVHLFVLFFHNLRSLKPDLLNHSTGGSGDRMAGVSGYLHLLE